MPRQARKESGTGIYHVMLRGINRQDIFEETEGTSAELRNYGITESRSYGFLFRTRIARMTRIRLGYINEFFFYTNYQCF